MGTEFRRLVEPLDIANYYRHLKNEGTGPYMGRARQTIQVYTEMGRAYDERLETGASSESCFWAETEELVSKTNKKAFDGDFKKRVDKLEDDLNKWRGKDDEIVKNVLLEETTFMKWWKERENERGSQCCRRRSGGRKAEHSHATLESDQDFNLSQDYTRKQEQEEQERRGNNLEEETKVRASIPKGESKLVEEA
ncbi:hypothetical protein K1719_024078 [Acacia pycnantha]|nr:hypothetical protein K1719_024078 [Acacia pycnantha]